MKSLKPKARNERQILDTIRRTLRQKGSTVVDKTHGTRYSAGWPDLFVKRPATPAQWVEVKTPRGKLTRAQRARFARWDAAGIPIWVLTSADDLELLDGPSNVGEWL